MAASWILVCDASRARIFSCPEANAPWELEHELDRPAARAKVHELVSDKTGRVQQSGNTSLRPSMEAPTDKKEVEAQRFARELAEILKTSHATARYDKLVVAAPPHFLGMLRQSLDVQVERAVTRSINKDFTQLDEAELVARLREP